MHIKWRWIWDHRDWEPRWVAIDVDTCCTNGTEYANYGPSMKRFHLEDALAIRELRKHFKVVLLNGDSPAGSVITKAWAHEIGVEATDVKYGERSKWATNRFGSLGEGVFVSDSFLDMSTLQVVELGISTSSAINQVQEVASATTNQPAGARAIAEITLWILGRVKGAHR